MALSHRASSHLSMFDDDPSLADDHHWYSMYHHSFKDVEVHGLRGEGGVTVSGRIGYCGSASDLVVGFGRDGLLSIGVPHHNVSI